MLRFGKIVHIPQAYLFFPERQPPSGASKLVELAHN
jgi:hypothetical protein